MRLYPQWDAQIAAAFPKILQVDQPLRVLISPETWATVERVAGGLERPLSTLNCYFDASMANGVRKIS